jgi:hypothetical protein
MTGILRHRVEPVIREAIDEQVEKRRSERRLNDAFERNKGAYEVLAK